MTRRGLGKGASRGRALAVAFSFGAGYGFLTLEAISPLAIVLLIWLVVMLFWTWRLPLDRQVQGVAASGFLVGFAAVWLPILGHIASTCTPPGCQTTDAGTDLVYAVAFTLPVIVLAAAEAGIRLLLLKRTSR